MLLLTGLVNTIEQTPLDPELLTLGTILRVICQLGVMVLKFPRLADPCLLYDNIMHRSTLHFARRRVSNRLSPACHSAPGPAARCFVQRINEVSALHRRTICCSLISCCVACPGPVVASEFWLHASFCLLQIIDSSVIIGFQWLTEPTHLTRDVLFNL